MDNIFEIVVFLITAIIFVVSAITKQKKKPNGASTGTAENILESLFGISTETGTQETAQKNTAELYSEENDLLNEKKAVKKEVVEVLKEDDTDYEEERALNVDFDLRQAVIYSEILKRKEY